MKATEFTLKHRPYSDDEAKSLLASVMDAETSDWHYNTHHKGYVDKLNEIEKALVDADPTKANGNYSQIGELKRRIRLALSALSPGYFSATRLMAMICSAACVAAPRTAASSRNR